jgi:hypothetical protein
MSFEADYNNVKGQLDALRTALANGEASDGHHTHNELYEYRLLYNAHAALAFAHAGWEVTRSWRHHSGEECFGGGWFVVQADTPAGQVTNHYQADHWYLFEGIPDVETSPAWDGHTPPIAAQRLEAAITFLRQAFAQQKESDEATQLRSQLDGLRRAYEHACAQRDKYMRRTAEWRDVAVNDRNRQDVDWLISELGDEHWRECDLSDDECHVCEGVKGIKERLKVVDDGAS